jgi:hypothetical protein
MGISGKTFNTPLTTWTWDGATWTQQHPSTNPPGRIQEAIGYDPATEAVILFGGYNGYGPASQLSDTWAWDGTNWVQQQLATSPPGGPAYGAFDASRQTFVVLTQGQTWLWSHGGWTQAHPAHSPGYRLDEAVTYDPSRRQVILFGGKVVTTAGGRETDTPMSDLWDWNGQDWVQIAWAIAARGHGSLRVTLLVNGTVIAANCTSLTGIDWHWGDGTLRSTCQYFPESHAYAQSGTYTVTVTAMPSNGSQLAASENVDIS